MIRREVTVTNRLGLHARAAARFVQTATRFRSKITLGRDGKAMDGKSILGILLLAAAQGSTLIVTADGDDEEAAIRALAALITGRFGEES
jgi:phosphocarrier protein HPr